MRTQFFFYALTTTQLWTYTPSESFLSQDDWKIGSEQFLI